MTVQIRRMNADDIQTMRGMSAMFAAAFNDTEAYQSKPRSDEYLRHFLGRGNAIVLAALGEANTVVGGLVAYICSSSNSNV